MRTDSGQAMLEFIVGMFALVLLISTFMVIGDIIPKATHSLSIVRRGAGRNAQDGAASTDLASTTPRLMELLDKCGAPYTSTPIAKDSLRTEINVGCFAAQYLFGEERMRTTESAFIPAMDIPHIRSDFQMEARE